MSPNEISSLVNLGAAGAVIIVVIIFVRSNEKRDAEWRAFFSEIHKADAAALDRMTLAIDKITGAVDCLTDKVEDHDAKVESRYQALVASGQPKGKGPWGSG